MQGKKERRNTRENGKETLERKTENMAEREWEGSSKKKMGNVVERMGKKT